ncbi:SGNH hydrolase [Sporormia fimetaria CBS 119925]|uniref:SGNH hydrolase n=1 Tax=Sporormia fimetaria CBS 119925 TaxID=1340428 RepID=A0A6A6VKT1_9PLEO|nr:SGNH hydrolase [Sporormia fimetaria CBS 119925]
MLHSLATCGLNWTLQCTPYDQFFLFGDSITQDSDNQERGFGSAAALQHTYIRRLDVVNRGFSGYNTRDALKVLPRIIPSPQHALIRVLVVFFGANDASLPQQENNQHIPLSEYKENLEKIVTHPLVAAHNARIILVAPPPIDEYPLWESDKEKGRTSQSRFAAVTKTYADGACEVAAKLRLPVVNLWMSFMSKAGFDPDTWQTGQPLPGSMSLPQNDVLKELLYDGLHFNPAAYKILFNEIMDVVAKNWPHQLPQNLPMVFPAWSDRPAWDAFEASS